MVVLAPREIPAGRHGDGWVRQLLPRQLLVLMHTRGAGGCVWLHMVVLGCSGPQEHSWRVPIQICPGST